MNDQIVELIQTGSQVHWGVAIPQYFFLTGISAAAFLLSTLTYVFGDKRYESIAGLSLIVAFTVLVAAPLNLIADLGQPGRFYSLLYHFHGTSPMSWGVFLLSSYPLLIALEMAFVFRARFARRSQTASGLLKGFYRLLALGSVEVTPDTEARDHRIGKILGTIGIPTALAVHGYTGYILGVVRARAMWHTSLMPLIFLISAMVSGVALMILLSWIMVRNDRGKVDWSLMDRLGILLAWSIVGDLILRLLWYTIGLSYSSASFQEVGNFIFGHHFMEAVVLELGLGLLLPLVVMTVPALRRIRPLFILTVILAIFGVMLFRWDTVIGGQLIPKIGAGFYEYIPSFWGRTGVMHIIGNWGFWILFFILFTSFLPWKKTSGKNGRANQDKTHTDSILERKGAVS
ncbi:oxidoreductase [Desulfolithobacter dissulfuricans]|uniref:Oxidoreductase n=1 Tax=Desulfolithobacter dissulfuricans TaxID=2795293 RepID=A0A915TXW5_9BACT|nr:NrfD/PsrC family molybdoenzyme membrane anchor subunit [Desulfolithobacter dissulfuricans]BCO08018.1 oxidoreductase [Desulfolithobacter dissulfuricans]